MAGRGRGRGAGGASGQLKGATWEHDPSIKLESKPNDLFPRHPHLKRPAPLTDRELNQIKHYKELQTRIHRGPLFTQPTKRDLDAPAKTFSEDQFNRQYGSNRLADMNPFNGVETYSMRYAPKKNVLPKLSSRPFDKRLFPEELWSALEAKEGDATRNTVNGSIFKKAPRLGIQDPNDKTEALLQTLQSFEDAEDDDGDEDVEQEEVDEAYEDDELGDDYNAEGYFDDGEGDEDEGGGENDDY